MPCCCRPTLAPGDGVRPEVASCSFPWWRWWRMAGSGASSPNKGCWRPIPANPLPACSHGGGRGWGFGGFVGLRGVSVLVLGCCAGRLIRLFLDMLLRQEGGQGELGINPFLKHRRPLVFSAYGLVCSFSAGHGGEGEEQACSAAAAVWGWCLFSSCSVLVSSRGTGRVCPNLSDELLRMEKKELVSGAGSFHKRVCCVPSGMVSVLLLLAGRGGEGEDEDGVSAGLGWRFGWWRCEFDTTSTACLVISTLTSSSFELHCFLPSCSATFSLLVAVHVGCVFLLFGTGRRRVRSSLLRFLRFNSQEPPDLSSVLDISYLQLNPLPQRRLPTRLLVEPLALWLARLREALKECDCRFVASEFSTDPLAGSGCTLRHVHVMFSVTFFGVQLGFFFRDESCNHCCILAFIL